MPGERNHPEARTSDNDSVDRDSRPTASTSSLLARSIIPHLLFSATAVAFVLLVVLVGVRQRQAISTRSHLINHTGRQRMFCQSVTQHALQAQDAQGESNALGRQAAKLRETTEQWSESNRYLGDALNQSTLDLAASQFADLQPQFVAMSQAAHQLVSLAETGEQASNTAERFDEGVRVILDREDDYLAGMDRVVLQVQAAVDRQLQFLAILWWSSAGLAALVIAIETSFVVSRTRSLQNLAAQQQLEIARRRRAEETLVESQRRYELAVTGSGNGLWDWHITTNELYMSPRFKELLGYQDHELENSYDDWQALLHPDDRESTLAAMQAHLDAGTTFDVEYRLRTRLERWRWFLTRGEAIRDESGQPVRMSGELIDIHERKDIEQALRRVNDELESFCYAVSHDLRAPLRHIDGFSAALIEDYAETLDESARTMVDMVHESCVEMSALIDDLLSLSRVTRSTMDCESVDLTGVVREIAQELQRREPQRKVEWVIAENLSAPADPTLLKRALYNLLENAWKYSSRRTVAQIEFGSSDDSHRLGTPVYFIGDNGVGFNMDYANKLFQPFQRLHGSGDFPGTGIGLAIVKRAIERHGGTVWASGEEDRGATFSFTLGGDPQQWERREGHVARPYQLWHDKQTTKTVPVG